MDARENPDHIGPLGLVVFDGQCGFCRRWIRRMNSWFARHPRAIPWQTAPLADLGLTAEQCTRAVQFVGANGRISGGSDAAARILIVAGLPWSLAGRCMLAPGIRQVAQASYRWVADNRHRFKGDPIES